MKITPRIQKARDFCIKMHEGQTRKDGSGDYYHHPFDVADILSQINTVSEDLIIAGYLHDVIEDCFPDNKEEGRNLISNYFGEGVAYLCWGVTNQSKKSDGNRAQRKAIDAAHVKKGNGETKTLKLADVKSNCQNIREELPEMAEYYIPEKLAMIENLKEGDPILYANVVQILKG